MKTAARLICLGIKLLSLPVRWSWKILHWLGVRQFTHRRWAARLPAVLAAGMIATAILPVLGIRPAVYSYVLSLTLLAIAASIELLIVRHN